MRANYAQWPCEDFHLEDQVHQYVVDRAIDLHSSEEIQVR
jgi:hypothetical protein